MRFSKMHGLGNDFIIINGFTEQLPEDMGEFARRICHRQLGVGGDGVILLTQPLSDKAVARYLIYNSDGTEAGMCGNGLRCAALFAKRQGIVEGNDFTFEVLTGSVRPHIIDDVHGIVRVDMDVPRLLPADIPAKFTGSRVVSAPLEALARKFDVTLVSMGNPHCVIFVDDVADFPVEKIGPVIENHDLFPARTNVEFIQLLSDKKIKMRVWERSCGETDACGSGACAATVAAILNGYTQKKVEVQLRYGSLEVEWAEDGHVYMTGPATLVAEGDYLDL